MLLLHTNVLGHLGCDLQLRVQTVDEKKLLYKLGTSKVPLFVERNARSKASDQFFFTPSTKLAFHTVNNMNFFYR